VTTRRIFKNPSRSQAHTGRVAQLISRFKRAADSERLSKLDWYADSDNDGLIRIVPNTKGSR
jgi:hypothetical protein